MEPSAAEMSVESTSGARPGALARLAGAWSRSEPLLHPWTWWIVWGVLAVEVAIMATSRQKPGADFAVFQRAAARLLGHENLYQVADGHWIYKYAPAVSFLFVPFALFALRTAWTIFDLISAFALVRVMRWSALRLGRGTGLLAHLAILFAVNPYIANLFRLGQVDAVLLWLVIESEESADRRPWVSGLLWATACLFKPPFLVLLPAALAFRQWRRLAGLAAGALGWTAAGALWFGTAGHFALLRAWRGTLAATTPGLICNEQNQSLWAIACTYFAPPTSGMAFLAALAGLSLPVVLLATWAVIRAHRRDVHSGRPLAAAAGLYLAGLLSPLGWRTNFIGAIPLLYLLLGLARATPAPALRRATVVAFCAGVAGEALDRVAGWFLGPLRAHELLLRSRYFGLAALLCAVIALAAAARQTPPAGPEPLD